MIIYKATFKFFGEEPIRLITEIEVKETDKTFVYENNRLLKKDLNVFKTTLNDTTTIFARNAIYLTEEEALKGLEDMFEESVLHFQKIVKEAEKSLNKVSKNLFSPEIIRKNI
jgi:GTPase involved in cell partitioning and DNA repair